MTDICVGDIVQIKAPFLKAFGGIGKVVEISKERPEYRIHVRFLFLPQEAIRVGYLKQNTYNYTESAVRLLLPLVEIVAGPDLDAKIL